MTTGPDPTTSLATNPATNHLTTLGAVYDAAGNLVQWTPAGTTTNYGYVYDPLGAMTEVKVNGTTKQYHIYTADDERIWTLDSSTGTDVSHWKIRGLDAKVLRDYVNTGNTWTVDRDYFYRDGQLLAAVTPSGTLHFSLDHLGTPRIVTNGAATRVGFHHYFPFGKEWVETDDADDFEVMRFTGHEHDTDGVGGQNIYMHARFYAPDAFRFTAIDPLPVSSTAHEPQSWNRYAYVTNKPLAYVDPTGLLGRPANDPGAYLMIPTVDYATEGGGIFGHPATAFLNSVLQHMKDLQRLRKLIADIAASYDGDENWALDGAAGPGRGVYKCNAFVAKVVRDAGGTIPDINGDANLPPVAGQWGDANFDISGWIVVVTPRRGDVVAVKASGADFLAIPGVGHIARAMGAASGHVAFYTGSQRTTGAAPYGVKTTMWPWRPDDHGVIVIRRYVGN
jgi:RHS repeat-associated protein